MTAAAPSKAHTSLVRFSALADLQPSELTSMMPMVEQYRRLSPRSYLQNQGEPSKGIYLLLDGWTASSVMMPDGKRQILKVHLPGDLIGLPGLPFTASPDSVIALTKAIVGHISLAALGRLFTDAPRIAALLFLISQEERSLLMDRLALLGRKNTLGRLAGILLQLRARMFRQDPAMGDTLHLPLTQSDLADMVGSTSMHINRSLMDLRRQRIVTWQRRTAIIHDLNALRKIAGLPDRVLVRNHSWLPASASTT